MSERTVIIEPRDPIIFRDGKPFGASDAGARSLDFPVPATVIGAIRTRCGIDTDYDPDTVQRLKTIRQIGPFLASANWGSNDWKLLLPAPADVVLYQQRENEEPGNRMLDLCPLRPSKHTGGTDLPAGLHPLRGARMEKAASATPAYWTLPSTISWLAHPSAKSFAMQESAIGHGALPRQKRVHVSLNANSQTAEEGMLFTTDGLEFLRHSEQTSVRYALLSKVAGADNLQLPGIFALGGERRLALWHDGVTAKVEWPHPPPELAKVRRLRLQLLTPAFFKEGWLPGWCSAGEGHPLRDSDLKLRLISAAVPRAVPASGWDLELKGPKGTRFLAPAGSVYFFEASGDPSALWMQSICDDQQDRKDGFGIVLTGEWEWHNN